MSGRGRFRVVAICCIVAGTAIVAWWAVRAALLLPVALESPREPAFVSAELLTAALLISGGTLELRGLAPGSSLMLAGLGSLLYAIVAVLGVFYQRPLMFGVMLLAFACTVGALAAMMWHVPVEEHD